MQSKRLGVRKTGEASQAEKAVSLYKGSPLSDQYERASLTLSLSFQPRASHSSPSLTPFPSPCLCPICVFLEDTVILYVWSCCFFLFHVTLTLTYIYQLLCVNAASSYKALSECLSSRLFVRDGDIVSDNQSVIGALTERDDHMTQSWASEEICANTDGHFFHLLHLLTLTGGHLSLLQLPHQQGCEKISFPDILTSDIILTFQMFFFFRYIFVGLFMPLMDRQGQ